MKRMYEKVIEQFTALLNFLLGAEEGETTQRGQEKSGVMDELNSDELSRFLSAQIAATFERSFLMTPFVITMVKDVFTSLRGFLGDIVSSRCMDVCISLTSVLPPPPSE